MGSPPHIAIIGGGFTGSAAAIHVSRASTRPARVTLIDPRDPGPGFAHGSQHPDHRLNGPDTIHLIYPEVPDHFASWMRSSGALDQDPEAKAATGLVFARRRDFGRYVSTELQRELARNQSAISFSHVRASASDLFFQGNKIAIKAGACTLEADACILATGWDAPECPLPLCGIAAHPNWINDPWEDDRRRSISVDSSVLIVGTGLSAADVTVSLLRQGHRGPIFCVSRHGLRPADQNPHRGQGSFWDRITAPVPPFIRRHGRPASLRSVIRALRKDIDGLDPASSSWHVPFDEMRDASSLYWPMLPQSDKQRFVRHLKRWYDALRYRYPPQTQIPVDAGVQAGQVRFVAAHINGGRIEANGKTLLITARGSRSHEDMRFSVSAAINCTSAQSRPSRSTNALIQELVQAGIVRDSPSGMGVDVDLSCRAIASTGAVHRNIFVLGPATSGSVGETTAVPFITRQIMHVMPEILRAVGIAQ